jgi:hypothetical protein
MFAFSGLAPPRSGNAPRRSPSPLSRRINIIFLSPLFTCFPHSLFHPSLRPPLSGSLARSDLDSQLDNAVGCDGRSTDERCDISLARLPALLLKTFLSLDDAHSPLCGYDHSRVLFLLAFERSRSFSHLVPRSVSFSRSLVTSPASIQHVACSSVGQLTCRVCRRSSYSRSER